MLGRAPRENLGVIGGWVDFPFHHAQLECVATTPYNATLRVRMPFIIGILHPSVKPTVFGGLRLNLAEAQFKSASVANVNPPPTLFRATTVRFCPALKVIGPVSTRTRVVPGSVKNTLNVCVVEVVGMVRL